jgi:hypothetical protein
LIFLPLQFLLSASFLYIQTLLLLFVFNPKYFGMHVSLNFTIS